MLKRRIGRKNFLIYAYDIETHADEESLKERKTGVWLSSFINDESKELDDANFFYDVESWLDKLQELSSPERRKHRKGEPAKCNNILIYVWNLAFEYSAILPVMIKRGFEFKEEFSKEDSFVFNSITSKTCSSVWCVKMKFAKNGGAVILRDLAKIFMGSLRSVAESMNLETQKGDIEYTLDRRDKKDPKTGEIIKYKPTDEEKIYNFKDTRIIIDILLEMDRRNDREFWSAISCASYSFKKMLRETFSHSPKPIEEYRKKYPILSTEEDEFIHHSIAGGLTYANPRWQYVEIEGKIKHIDYHQSYPSSMASMRGELFPYGKGEYHKGQPGFDKMRRWCCHVRVSYSGVKLHSIIQLIGLDCLSDKELWLWDFEIATMERAYYDFEIEYIDYYEYHVRELPFKGYFLRNYAKRLKAKERGDAFEVFQYKILNNSIYGKFEENPHDFVFENVIDDDGFIDSIKHEKDEATHGKYAYFPVGACISAFARSRLINDALTLSPDGSSILYMDTDSLFYIDNEETRKNLKYVRVGEKLGDFGFEDDCDKAQFTAPKRYKLRHEDGKTEIKAGGFTIPKSLKYEDANLVEAYLEAKTRLRAEGGTLIVVKEKELGVQEKYKAIFKDNAGKVYNTIEGITSTL